MDMASTLHKILDRLERLERLKTKAAFEDVKLERDAIAFDVHLQQFGS